MNNELEQVMVGLGIAKPYFNDRCWMWGGHDNIIVGFGRGIEIEEEDEGNKIKFAENEIKLLKENNWRIHENELIWGG